ncbi:peptide chain release factor N(5)-glutamine methyltransferase [Sphingomonas quercus]|uniref:Release factor glutamine methyltransferase n=1 Tax=Sphingomonas quercus TaxID=2842451 RepID=A0ABS6BEX1_9SPHN|nr:peptide chain release factor N(5)-glutamine methyltransferase [Sphingomonas quercus]MBU3076850.1 peptide chain release factor N(5)-glutamine methyltransferase [Sphingomonas quercus]
MAETLRAAIARAAAAFAEFSDTGRLDAELLAAHALGVSRDALLLGRLDDAVPAGFAALVARRLAHEPVAYIVGRRDFWTVSLAVGPGVLVPRADSETLIEAAVEHFAGTAGPRSVLDLGTGSGALLLAALDQWPRARGVGVDASPAAVAIAAGNAAILGMAARAEIRPGGWEGDGRAHDLVLCNPPYVEAGAALPREVAGHEPASALFAGADGLDDYRRLAPLIGAQIAPGGVACIEIGSAQAESAGALFRAAGLRVALRPDLAGRPRCLVVTTA